MTHTPIDCGLIQANHSTRMTMIDNDELILLSLGPFLRINKIVYTLSTSTIRVLFLKFEPPKFVFLLVQWIFILLKFSSSCPYSLIVNKSDFLNFLTIGSALLSIMACFTRTLL